ncbi:MAG: response regulator, partial [Deltaproteobacteria bacterium]|nr:response regulator [Deltaproteobacteria bacterium]
MARRSFISLELKLVLLAGFLVSSAVGLTVWQMGSKQEAIIQEEMQKKALAMIGLVDEQIRDPLYNLDAILLRNVMAEVRSQKDVLYGYIYDLQGRVIVDGTPENPHFNQALPDPVSRKAVASRKTLLQTVGDVLDVSTPVMIVETIGGVRIGMDLKPMRQQIREVRSSTAQLATVMLLASLLCTFLLAKFLTRPIKQLEKGARRIGEGEFEFSIEVRSRDEIGRLAESFSAMAAAVARRFKVQAALLSNSQAVSSSLNIEGILGTIVSNSVQMLGAQTASIYLTDEGRKVLKLAYSSGEGGPGAGSFEDYPVQEGAGFEPVIEDHSMAVPIAVKEQLIGVLAVRWGPGERAEPEDRELLSGIAAQAAIAIENVSLFRDLQTAFERLKQTQEHLVQNERLRALGEMAGGVAHDFNNLLGAILGRAQLMLLQTRDEGLVKSLKVIERAALDGAETIRRIQEFTLVRRDERFAVLDVNQVITTAVETTRHRWRDDREAAGRPVAMRLDLGEVPPVEGSQAELGEVLINLILNALDAMPEGGEIAIRTAAVDGTVQLSVADTGHGMSWEVQRRIFDPYFTTKGPQGMGLGLSVTYGIIARHRGTIEVSSAEGQGATFVITLPVAPAEPPAESLASTEAPAAPSTRLLVIDDEVEVREVIADLLQAHGHAVQLAKSGMEGLERFERERYDLVITDLGMPEMTGWEVAKRVKARSPATPVVLITGWGMQLSEEQVQAGGVDFLLSKPFNVEQILRIIADASGR